MVRDAFIGEEMFEWNQVRRWRGRAFQAEAAVSTTSQGRNKLGALEEQKATVAGMD